jgi:hypothetical protein
MSENPFLELAHSMPGRLRLRWRGEAPPPPGFLSRLEHSRRVTTLQFRPSSRSLVLETTPDFDLTELRDIAGEFDLPVRDPAPASEPPPRRLEARRTSGALVVADLEALLLLGLMATWVRDLFVARALRVGTIIFLILTGLHVARYLKERFQEPEPPMELLPDEELELMSV